MGNWRRVQIIGTCVADEVAVLRQALTLDKDLENFHCLICAAGIMGLPMWASQNISAIGNLAERNYTPRAVANQLEELAKAAPSLSVKVHCGNDYEAADCVATVTLKNSIASVGAPEIDEIPKQPRDQAKANLIRQMQRGF